MGGVYLLNTFPLDNNLISLFNTLYIVFTIEVSVGPQTLKMSTFGLFNFQDKISLLLKNHLPK